MISNIEVLDSKKYVREGSPALSVKEYLEPVIDEMLKYCDESDISIRYSHEQQNANEDNSINTSYARVLVQGKFKDFTILDSGATVGFVYALDKQIPEFITYSGHEVFACTNLSIYADEDVSLVKDNHKIAHKNIGEYINSLEKQQQKYINFHNNLQQKELSLEDLDTTIGHILRECIVKYKKVGTSAVLHAHKELLNPRSNYAIKNNSTNLWNVYNAVTDFYSGKFLENQGLLERPLKTKELFNIFSTTL
jgi:hypothetical protein